MTDLVEELQIWLDAEMAQPDEICKNDDNLLMLVQTELTGMRKYLLKNTDDKDAWEKYRALSNKFMDLLAFRTTKYIKIKNGGR